MWWLPKALEQEGKAGENCGTPGVGDSRSLAHSAVQVSHDSDQRYPTSTRSTPHSPIRFLLLLLQRNLSRISIETNIIAHPQGRS
jgi:hypothetical protein